MTCPSPEENAGCSVFIVKSLATSREIVWNMHTFKIAVVKEENE